jgi:hypothetical protein
MLPFCCIEVSADYNVTSSLAVCRPTLHGVIRGNNMKQDEVGGHVAHMLERITCVK